MAGHETFEKTGRDKYRDQPQDHLQSAPRAALEGFQAGPGTREQETVPHHHPGGSRNDDR